MRDMLRAAWLPLLSSGLFAVGCTMPSPWTSGTSATPMPSASIPGSATGMPGPALQPPAVGTGTEMSTPLSQATQGTNGFDRALPSGNSAATASVLASFKKTRDSMASAFQIKPHITPAPDPVKLDSAPADANSTSADLHYHAARVFESTNNLDSAARHYRDALAKAPQDARLHTGYARLLDRAGKFAEAEAEYRLAIQLNPNDMSAVNDLAMCSNRQSRRDVAVDLLQRAIQKEPTNPLYRNNLALVLVDSGRPVDAFHQLASVHGEAGAHYNLGYMLFDRGRREEAEQHFMRAMELNPQLTQAQEMLELVQQQAAAQPVAGGSPARPQQGMQDTARLPALGPRSF